MNLREQAEADLAITLEDVDSGFGCPIKLTDSNGKVYEVFGQYHRIEVDIDPSTGLKVMGEGKSAVTLRLSSLQGAEPEEDWLVETKDIAGKPIKGRVTAVAIDWTLGFVNLMVKRG